MTIGTTPSSSHDGGPRGTSKDGTISTWSGLLAADRPTVTRTELASLLRIDARTESRAIDDSDIPAVRFGRQWFISRQAIITMFGDRS